MPSGTSSRCQATWRIVNVSVRGASRSLASVSLGCVVRQVGGDDVVRAHHPPCLAELTEIRWSPTAGSTFSTAFCKVERRPSNQTVSSTASHRPSNIPFAWFILFERNRQAWADVQTNQAKFRECWREGLRGGWWRAPSSPPSTLHGSYGCTASNLKGRPHVFSSLPAIQVLLSPATPRQLPGVDHPFLSVIDQPFLEGSAGITDYLNPKSSY